MTLVLPPPGDADRYLDAVAELSAVDAVVRAELAAALDAADVEPDPDA